MKIRTGLIKYLISLLIFSSLFFTIGFAYKYHLPKIETWLLIELEQYTKNNLPMRVYPKKVSLKAFPLGVQFSELKVLPKSPLKSKLAPFKVKHLTVSLSWLAILRGEIRISNVELDSAELSILVKNEFKPKSNMAKIVSPKKYFDFSILKSIPLDQLIIKNMNIIASDNRHGLSLKVTGLRIKVENQLKALYTEINIPKLTLKRNKYPALADLYIDTQFLLTPNSIKIAGLKIKKKKSYVVATGEINANVAELKYNKSIIKTRMNVNLREITQFSHYFFKELMLPNLTGHAYLDTNFSHSKGEKLTSNFKLKTKKLNINQFVIGNITLEGHTTPSDILLKNAMLENNSGKITSTPIQIPLSGAASFKTSIKIHDLELSQLLKNLDLKRPPLRLNTQGELNCKITIKPKFKVNCNKSRLKISHFHLFSDKQHMQESTIVDLSDVTLNGGVTVDSNKVTYSSSIKIKNSTGSSKGTISYQKGFYITYKTAQPGLAFDDINNLVHLNLGGTAMVTGSTAGTSKYATINMRIRAKDFLFQDFKMGKVSTDLKYKSGTLYFKKIVGKYKQNRYFSDLNINLTKSRIYLKGRSEYFNIQDTQEMLIKHLKIPFDFTGSGQMDIVLNSPLNLKKLNYDLNFNLFRGTLAKENYDEIKGHINSKNGKVTTNNITLNKSNSTISLKGSVLPDTSTNIDISARNFRIEESKHISNYGLNLTGQIDLDTKMTGPLNSPNLLINGRLSKVLIAEYPQRSSAFSLNINKQFVSGRGALFGNTLTTDFKFPISKNENFKFVLITKNWDFIKLFNLFAKKDIQKKYHTRLNLHADLKSKRGGLWNSTGAVTVNSFNIERGSIKMSSKNSPQILFNKGKISTHNFKVTGENTFAELVSKNTVKNNLNLELTGKINLGLAAILTPLEDLSGLANAKIKITGKSTQPKFMGSAYIHNTTVKIKDFPHSFTELSADILFNDDKAYLNAAKAKFANGDARASGKIIFSSLDNIQVDARGDFENVSLNFPKNIITHGSGTLYLTGHWFPYELGGIYNITGGEFKAEFTDANSSSITIAPSRFLPKFLVKKGFEPLSLNLNIEMLKPIHIRNSQMTAPIQGQLAVTGTPTNPILNGQLLFKKGGQIAFRKNSFELQRGNVEFKNSSPDNPNLFIAALTQIESNDINYDISLLMQGSGKNPKMNLISSPPLSEVDLVTLLALGITTTELEKTNSQEQATQTSYQIGSALLASPIGKQFKKRFGLDVQISSDFEEQVAVPKVTLKKQFTPKLSGAASQTLGDKPKFNAKAQYKFDNNWSVIGFYDSTEETDDSDNTTKDNDSIGIDLEYRFKFK